jgi:hypothetical protein
MLEILYMSMTTIVSAIFSALFAWFGEWAEFMGDSWEKVGDDVIWLELERDRNFKGLGDRPMSKAPNPDEAFRMVLLQVLTGC